MKRYEHASLLLTAAGRVFLCLDESRSVSQLAEMTGISAATTHRALGRLRKAGLVECHVALGRWVWQRRVDSPLEVLQREATAKAGQPEV